MKIIITGDFCPRYRGTEVITNNLFKDSFSEVANVVRNADYSITNLECPVIEDSSHPIVKMGPNLHCSSAVSAALKYLGFSCLTLANNHIMDFGKRGLENTMKFCDDNGFDYVGVGLSEKEAIAIKYVRIADETLAIINCCEFEFSISKGADSGANHLDPIKQFYSIREAKRKAKYVLVIVHGGHEHWQLPSPRMVDTYRFFIEAGADVVVNHHQHCYSGFEIYNNKPIFYGLGNFFFDQRPIKTFDKWNYGYMVELELGDIISYKIHPYEQCSKTPSIHLLEKTAFDYNIKEINNIIANNDLLQAKTNEYYSNCERDSAIVLEPIQNRYFNGLQYRRLLPFLRRTKKITLLYNFILCESHRDKLQFFLTHKLSNQ